MNRARSKQWWVVRALRRPRGAEAGAPSGDATLQVRDDVRRQEEIEQLRTASDDAQRLVHHPTTHQVSERRTLDPRPIGFHVILRLEDDRPLATTSRAIRRLVRVVLSQGEHRGLLAFGTADSHLHAALATDRASAGAFARYVETALRWQLDLGARFERARIRPIHDQSHAYNAFHYAHRQDARHKLELDRAREGTTLPDLLGLRVVPTTLRARVRAHLPRIRREDLAVQLPSGVFEENGPIELDVLADAAAAAFAIPDLRGRSPEVTLARRAAVHAAGPGVASELIGDCLGIRVRAVQALRLQPVEPLVVRAVAKQALVRTLLKQ